MSNWSVDHWRIAEIDSILGGCLGGLGRFEEGAPLLESAYLHLRDTLGSRHRLTRRALERIIQIYESWGRPERAEEWGDRRVETD